MQCTASSITREEIPNTSPANIDTSKFSRPVVPIILAAGHMPHVPPPFHYSIMSKTIEDEAVDGMCTLSSSPGQSQLSPTNAAASRKDAKKKANRIAALRSRHKKHWEKEINKLNGKKRFINRYNGRMLFSCLGQARSIFMAATRRSPWNGLSLFDLMIHLTNPSPSKPPVFNTSAHHRKR